MLAKTPRQHVAGKVIGIGPAHGAAQGVIRHDAEQAVLGAVLQDPDQFIALSELLQSADFHLRAHGAVWYAFEQLANRNAPIDMITVAAELENLKFKAPEPYTDKIGLWFGELIAKADRSDSAEAYANIVRESAVRMRGIDVGIQIQHLFANSHEYHSLGETIELANQLLFKATEQTITATDTSIRAAAQEYDQIAQAVRLGTMEFAGCDFGYENLNQLLGHAAPGEIVVIAGSSGMGKTTFMLGGVRLLAKRGKRVFIFTQEQKRGELIAAWMAMEAGIAKKALKGFELTSEEWLDFDTALQEIEGWDIHIVDEFNSMTQVQFRTKMRAMIAVLGFVPDLVVIDGLWLMEWVDERGHVMNDDRPRAVFNITRDLIKISEDLGVPLWIMHQYNDKAEARPDKRPLMSDLAESAGVKRNAKIIIGLYRDDYYKIFDGSPFTEAWVLKDRHGEAQGQYTEFGFKRDRNLIEPYFRRSLAEMTKR